MVQKGAPHQHQAKAGVESGTSLSGKSTAVNQTLCTPGVQNHLLSPGEVLVEATASAPWPQQAWEERGSPNLNSTFIFHTNSSPISTASFPNQGHV